MRVIWQLKHTGEGNWRWFRGVGSYPILLEWKYQYYLNALPNQIKLQILCHRYPTYPCGIFHTPSTNNPNSKIGSQRTKDLELPKQSCVKTKVPRLRTTLPSHSKQTASNWHKSRQTDQGNRIETPGRKCPCLGSINPWLTEQDYSRVAQRG